MSYPPGDNRNVKAQSPLQKPEVQEGNPYASSPAPRTLVKTGKPLGLQFQEIPIGEFFEYRSRRYRRIAVSMASDEERNGAIFLAQTEVMPDPFSSTP
jgi:hypothetical protein